MSLQELQRAFWRAVRYDPTPADALGHFVGDDRLDAAGRMDVYRKMYWYRQVDALADVFEHTRDALGAERFTKLACRYIRNHPSTHPALEHLGHALPGFLSRQAPEVSDLALLEWTRLLALVAPDPGRLCGAQDANPATFATAHLVFVPSLHVIEVQRAALQPFADGAVPEPSERAQIAVWRKGFGVQHLPLGALESDALTRARDGGSLTSALSVFPDDPSGIDAAFNMIRAWFSRQWIEGIET
ncbi:MAG: DNA-binding domain-containing protein [Myxococcales bacterium]|nr:DNA-binding domain-containing protein [Myxococcales bacterium]MDD9968073.1 DNA-binding domain-containing protein [Myxococcales bacterium]